MNIILFDDNRRDHLLPFTFTRPQAALRIGILTVAEKWERRFKASVSFRTQTYLAQKFPEQPGNDNLYIAGSLLPDDELVRSIENLKEGEKLLKDNVLLAFRNGTFQSEANKYALEYRSPVRRICNTWDIFSLNAAELELDFELLTAGRKSAELEDGNTTIGTRIFAEEGAKVFCSVLNASSGPIYLGANTEIWEGSLIRGGFALLEGASVKMGAKIYGATTVGPHSRVGGEISNCVIQGYSNKGHDGFLGNSVLGEWCNLGADTNNSNLKNNYAGVKLWDFAEQKMVDTGLQFCGLMMGDHSKCGINTMFNTGTVVGVSANIFGAGFPPNFIPSFSWGGAGSLTEYRFEQAAETAKRMMDRRHIAFDATEEAILNEVFRQTTGERSS
jgi:UDP-N-acetylglucosamine diphosphorylase/glucosamine-1-phosphate N-acetyltransferase